MAFGFSARVWNLLLTSVPSLASSNRCCLQMTGATLPTNPAPVVLADGSINQVAFSQQWKVFALQVPPKLTQGTVAALKNHVLRVPRVAAVAKAAGPDSDRIVLLRYFAEPPPNVAFSPRGNMDMSITGDSAAVAETVKAAKLGGKVGADVEALVRNVNADDLVHSLVELTYQHWSAEAILSSILPEGATIPSAFESVGHIAHINLRPEHENYKVQIAQVLLEKLKPRVRTVVNKTASTGGPYRTFAMEVLAGEDNLETTLKENGCTFTLDFSKVYWNSRLETEHRRIINSLSADDVLADAFCGIGPFAIPASRARKCVVYANDLNPDSVEYLRRNAAKNNISTEPPGNFHLSCGCAREFLTRIVRVEHVPITRVVMNFPSGAPEFLDTFCGLYAGLEDKKLPMPTVNCYCFARGDDWKKDATDRARRVMGLRDEDEVAITVREVRDVAPKKIQVCVSFVVPEIVAYKTEQSVETSARASDEVSSAPESKRQKV